jgi:aliphatic nitrilase
MGGGTTMFIDPMGQQTGDQIVGDDEGIAYADLDLNKCIEPKQFHDFVGGYQRYDIFKLAVDRTRQKPVKWENEAWEGPAEEPSDI